MPSDPPETPQAIRDAIKSWPFADPAQVEAEIRHNIRRRLLPELEAARAPWEPSLFVPLLLDGATASKRRRGTGRCMTCGAPREQADAQECDACLRARNGLDHDV